ncbi:MAG: tetratricopeptide repeat protein [Flavobacteriia bacterium]|nr:tetratricopeptide repeat protein [Flavobacteriia bacterium]OJX37120.1 MAG: hypothetical protein BGO87_15275 [Flavobacteriia bacterium 40-80]
MISILRNITGITLLLLLCNVVYSQTAEELNTRAEKVLTTDPEKAYAFLLEAREKNNSETLSEKISMNFAIVKRIKGEYRESIRLSDEVLKKAKSEDIKASAYNNLGAAYKRVGENEKAIKNYISALSIYEKTKNLMDAATVENNVGLLYQSLEDFGKAKEYHESALKHFSLIKNQEGISKSYNMLGIVLANQEDLEGALGFFRKSYEIEQRLNNKVGISEAVNNIGGIYFYLGKIDSALVYFEKSLQIDRENKDYSNLADGLNNLAEVYMNSGDYRNARLNLDSSIYYSTKFNYANAYLHSLETYSYLFEMENNLRSSIDYLRKYHAAKDSVEQISNRENINELEKKYQTEKKERLLLQKEIELKRKTNLITIIFTVLFSFVIIAVLIYRSLRLRNKQQRQEFELKEAIATIETQNKLQEQRLAISRDLHDNIGAQLTFIISSVETLKYAFRITDEKINNKLLSIADFAKETITELRDTIWAMNHSEIDFEEIHGRISNFVEKAKKSSEHIVFNFEVDELLKNVVFSSVEGMNIYRIIQEAVNNSLKYADATRIDIHAEMAGNEIQLFIRDNGTGFNLLTADLGNGLQNMKKRAAEIMAICEINSEAGSGTEVILKMKK